MHHRYDRYAALRDQRDDGHNVFALREPRCRSKTTSQERGIVRVRRACSRLWRIDQPGENGLRVGEALLLNRLVGAKLLIAIGEILEQGVQVV